MTAFIHNVAIYQSDTQMISIAIKTKTPQAITLTSILILLTCGALQL